MRKFLKPKGWDNLLRYSAEAVTCTLNQTISCSFKYLPTTFEKSLILRI